MKLKIASLALLLSLTNFAQGQVKFRVNNLDADSLAALIPCKEGTAKIDAVNQLSNAICLKNLDSSMHLAEAAIALSEQENYKKGLADGYFNAGNVWFLRDSLEPTISNYLKALRIYEDLEPSQEFVNLCFHLGAMNYYTGTESVVRNNLKSLVYALDDKEGKYIYTYGFAFMQADPDSAIHYFKEALTFIDTAVNRTESAYAYCMIGQRNRFRYNDTHDTAYRSEAFRWYFKALALPGLPYDARMQALIFIIQFYLSENTGENIAITLNENTRKNIANALSYLQMAEKTDDAFNGRYSYRYQVSRLYAKAHFLLGNYRKAVGYLRLSLEQIEKALGGFAVNHYRTPILAYEDKYILKINKALCYQMLFDCYSALGDYKTAHGNYVLSKQAGEEIYLEQNQRLITMMEVTSKEEKAQSRIDLLARDNELKAMAIRQSRTLNLGIAGLFVVLVLMGLLFLRQNKIKNEHKAAMLEQKLLRLQMNPHFIFNALSNILNLINRHEIAGAANYLGGFSRLLRSTLESSRMDMIPFEKEVGSLTDYLELQKLRYRELLEYSITVDERIDREEVTIPPMLVQPFIENAIEHGIRHKQEPGRIDVRFTLDGRKIVCEVEDDGVGREKAWEAEAGEKGTHRSLATEIIQDRIRVLNKKFRDKVRLEIIDKVSETSGALGTRVVLDLPYGQA